MMLIKEVLQSEVRVQAVLGTEEAEECRGVQSMVELQCSCVCDINGCWLGPHQRLELHGGWAEIVANSGLWQSASGRGNTSSHTRDQSRPQNIIEKRQVLVGHHRCGNIAVMHLHFLKIINSFRSLVSVPLTPQTTITPAQTLLVQRFDTYQEGICNEVWGIQTSHCSY